MSYIDRIKPTHKGIATYLDDLKNKVYQVPAFTGNIFCKQKSDSLVFTETFSLKRKSPRLVLQETFFASKKAILLFSQKVFRLKQNRHGYFAQKYCMGKTKCIN